MFLIDDRDLSITVVNPKITLSSTYIRLISQSILCYGVTEVLPEVHFTTARARERPAAAATAQQHYCHCCR
jgi:ATP/ADP translocase